MLRAVAVADTTPRTILILDGLDESLASQSDPQNLEALLDLLSFLAHTRGSHMWIIACSRPTPELRSEFLDSFHIPINENNSDDVKILVDCGIDSLRTAWPHRHKKQGGRARYLHSLSQPSARPAEKLNIQDELELGSMRDHLISKSLGSMIWIKLVFSEVEHLVQRKEGFTLTQLRERVQSLPQDLEKLYREIVSRLRLDQDLQKSKTSERIFLWVTGSPEWGILQLQELHEALAIPDNPHGGTRMSAFNELESNRYQIGNDWDYFYSIVYAHCGGLLEFIPPSRFDNSTTSRVDEMNAKWSVHLIHHTAKSFLEAGDESWPLHIVEADAIQYVSEQSAGYLEIIFPPESQSILNTAPSLLSQDLTVGNLEWNANQADRCSVETFDHDHALALLQHFMDIPRTVKESIELIVRRLDSTALLTFALNTLRDKCLDDRWMTSQQLPDFLTWWLKDAPTPSAGTLATSAHLSAHLCDSGLINSLTLLFELREVFASHLMTKDMLLGIVYGASYAALQLRESSSTFLMLARSGEDLGRLIRCLTPWSITTMSDFSIEDFETDRQLRVILNALESIADDSKTLTSKSSAGTENQKTEAINSDDGDCVDEDDPQTLTTVCIETIASTLCDVGDTEAWLGLHSDIQNWLGATPLVGERQGKALGE
ncbi:hypothetical protein FSARC_1966 [Fusarium sarcochroum]|uniref:NACHT domain-containing protein n=1 Tax=Fusarium sarcochroum TaxID=1208366 RepID=A0A8H4XDH0_9HYPO|nr:hypothetical protein FSARC_1966 [Fusarium sarcochroum]